MYTDLEATLPFYVFFDLLCGDYCVGNPPSPFYLEFTIYSSASTISPKKEFLSSLGLNPSATASSMFSSGWLLIQSHSMPLRLLSWRES